MVAEYHEADGSSHRAQTLPPLGVSTLLWIVRKGRFLILESLVLFILLGLVFIHTQNRLYTAMAIVAPQESSQTSMQSGSSALQALGTLSGLSFGKGGNSFDEFMETLDTPLVAAGMQTRYGMLQKLFAGSWDPLNRRWREPSTVRRWYGGVVDGIMGAPQPTPPDVFSLAGYVTKEVKFIKDRDTGFITLRYSNTDPKFATYFLNALCSTVDASMRDAAKRRAAVNVEFLQDKLKTVQSTDMRQALIAMFEDQERALMLANSGETYAFRYIQPPIASNAPTWPASNKILAAAGALGLALGFVFSTFLYWPTGERSAWVGRLRRAGSATLFFAEAWS